MKQIRREPQSLRTRVLVLLLLAYVLNFLDRNVAGILAVPIRSEFHLSDTALSGLGVAFGLFYATIAIPIAWLADRRSRVNIIAVSVALWSLFSAACGVVSTYPQLIIARMGVAVGEAGAIAPSYSLITDYYPRERRSRALALYSLGIPVGSALGLFFGGWLAGHFSWRVAFVAVGLPGLFVAILIKLLVAEPERGRFDPQSTMTSPPAAGAAASLARNGSFWLLSLGAASGSITGYGLLFWLPSFFNRTFGMPVAETGTFFGSIFLIGGVAGIWLGGWLGDRLGASRPGAYALIPAVCLLVAIPFYAAGLFASTLSAVWILFTIAQVLALAWLGPVVTAVQHIVTPALRATASASFLFVNNLVGIAFGIFFFGRFSDAMRAAHGVNSLQYSILYGLSFYLLASIFYLLAAARLKRELAS
jgi:MFS family permease